MTPDQVLEQFRATGVQTCFHDRHIEPQIYAGLDGTNWRLADYEARGVEVHRVPSRLPGEAFGVWVDRVAGSLTAGTTTRSGLRATPPAISAKV